MRSTPRAQWLPRVEHHQCARTIVALLGLFAMFIGSAVAPRQATQADSTTYVWRVWPSPTDKTLRGVALIGDEVIAVGDGGTALVLRDGRWSKLDSGMTGVLYGVTAGPDKAKGWAFGAWGTILLYRDGELVDMPTTAGALIRDVYGEVVNETWAVGSNGVMLRLEDGRWVEKERISDSDLQSVRVFMDGDVARGWIAGGQCTHGGECINTTLKLTDGSWTVKSAPRPPLTSIEVGPDGGWGVGGYVGAALRRNDGTSWSEAESPVYDPLWAIDIVESGEGWVVGSKGTILHLVAGEWAVEDSGIDSNLNGIAMRNDGSGWAVGDGGMLLERQPIRTTRVYLPTTLLNE